jgi:hypothetical protein
MNKKQRLREIDNDRIPFPLSPWYFLRVRDHSGRDEGAGPRNEDDPRAEPDGLLAGTPKTEQQ